MFRRVRQDRQGGTVVLHIRERKDCTAPDVRGDTVESFWVTIKGTDSRCFVYVYSQLSCQDDGMDKLFSRQLRKISEPAAFNLTGNFLKHVEDNFRSQVLIETPSKGASYICFFENTEGLVVDVAVGSCLGHSSH